MPQPFARVGLHLDFRIQVPPIAALNSLATKAHDLGLNTLIIEWEASFPFDSHPIIPGKYAYNKREVTSFLAHCARLGLEVIPLQQCFGHVEYILRHERYAALRESQSDLCQLCPAKSAKALTLFKELFAELAVSHPSDFLQIGGDETYLLGHCPACRAKAAEVGKSRLYVDYFKRIAKAVVALGKRPVLWADMLIKHPEAAAEMPSECVFIDWNYGWQSNHFGDLAKLRQTGIEFWGAPAMRSSPDNHALTCWQTHLNNFRDFIPFARRSDYRAIILTSWSTSGLYGYHWEKPGEAIELLPMRRVYPVSGFDILLAAFREALRPDRTFDPMRFTRDYGRDRFGFDARESAALWRALTADASPLQPGAALGRIAASARRAKTILGRLRPRRNREEFGHLLLMADLREFHARFKLLEQRIQSSWLTTARLPVARRALAELRRELGPLNRRFARLNQRILYPGELLEEQAYRAGKLASLHDRLARRGRSSR
jgi:hexosaminidase